MLFALLLAVPSALEDPLISAVESFMCRDTCSVTLVSNARGSREIIRYSYKKPWCVIMSSGGHTVDKSDIGTLLENVKHLNDKGTLQIVGEENVNGRGALRVRALASNGRTSP